MNNPFPAVYLDYAATTPLAPEAREAMEPFGSALYGNPSNLHRFGREARRALDHARDSLSRSLGCQPKELYFTSGGTEADNLALFGIARAHRGRGNHLVVSSIEHHAVLEAAERLEREGFRVTRLPVDSDGRADPDDVTSALTPDTLLVSVMMANNEIGSLGPIEEIGAACRDRGVFFHTDAVQAAGILPIDLSALPVDALSISGHKFYGPKGVGALFVRSGVVFEPVIVGGAQERERRAGTENVAGIMGMARALEVALEHREEEEARLGDLRDRLYHGLQERIDGVLLNGPVSPRLPGNLNVSIEGADAESMLLNLDLAGIAASSGSACSSGAFEPSHVLLAIGATPERALSSLRFSLGRYTTEAEVDRVLQVMPEIVERVRAFVSPELSRR
ncbi:MAG: cysteine desulfurase [Armatimonadetes bacterium]|nr:cysteine desulfurase [Armatimonadota bacterium]